MGTIRFELQTERINSEGKAPVRLIYSVEGQRKFHPTGVSVKPENWYKQKVVEIHPDMKGKPLTQKEVDKLNKDLVLLTAKIKKLEASHELANLPYTSADIIAKLKGQATPKTKKEADRNEVIAFIADYIENNRERRARTSISVYNTVMLKLKDFRDTRKEAVLFESIDYRFFSRFHDYLTGLKKVDGKKKVPALNSITIAKILSTLKTLLSYAKKEGIAIPGNYSDYEIERNTPGEVVALTMEEFNKLLDYEFKPYQEALARVRDIFCFATMTGGLRISDMQDLKPVHIKGNLMEKTSVKTKKIIRVPIMPKAKMLLDKYAHGIYYAKPKKGEEDKKVRVCFPMISDQRINEHLKDIFKLMEFDEQIEVIRVRGGKNVSEISPKYELLSFHSSRKSWATICHAAGMPIELIMEAGGWESPHRVFSRYNNISIERIREEMLKVWEPDINHKKLKAV